MKKRIKIASVSLFLALCLSAVALQERDQGRALEKKFINPDTVPRPTGWTQVVTVKGGKLVFISGQGPFTKDRQLVGAGDIQAQTRQTFENLKECLKAAGGTFDDVVKINYYLRNIEHLGVVRKVRSQYLNPDTPPASTAVEVGNFGNKEMLIEIEAIAVVSE